MTYITGGLLTLNPSTLAVVRRVSFPGRIVVSDTALLGVGETGSIPYPWAGPDASVALAAEIEVHYEGGPGLFIGPAVIYSDRGTTRGNLGQQGVRFTR